jgi:glycosyltransferase involved in cell wall biosynthesis
MNNIESSISFPKISVITPTYNQGQFIEETIISVVGQLYPNLEYIILDAGSTDNTVDIIKKYESYISYWHSKKDNGQASAINEGFRRATGDILCWLNSDDTFLSGTLHYIAKQLNTQNKEFIFGNSYHQVEGTHHNSGSNVRRDASFRGLSCYDYIIQPASFWTRKLWEEVGELNEELTYVLDWDWFIRAKSVADRFSPTDRYMSVYRIHSQHKTGSKDNKRYEEFKWIYRKYLNELACEYFIKCTENKMYRSVIRKMQSKKDIKWYVAIMKYLYNSIPPRDLRDIAEATKYNF